jgi:acyl transferase domain-containing protein
MGMSDTIGTSRKSSSLCLASNSPRMSHKRIAIIGTSCRFAGADNAELLYQSLMRGEDCSTTVPESRFSADHCTDFPTSRAYFIQGSLDRFDAEFFRISGREAAELDPAHRLVLEETYHAFEDAGLTLEQVKGSRTACYVATLSSDFLIYKTRTEEHDYTPNTMKGYYLGFSSSRVAFAFDLRGPSMSLDTACSGSANSIWLGMQAIRSGEADMAVASGVHLMLTPVTFTALGNFGMLAPDGASKPFSGEANGYKTLYLFQ